MKFQSSLANILALLLIGLLFSPLAAAQSNTTITVNSEADLVDVTFGSGICEAENGKCTLRAAIQTANATAGVDTIILPAGTYSLTINERRATTAGEINTMNVANGDLDISDSVIIKGESPSATVIQGHTDADPTLTFNDRIFDIAELINVSISNLTIRNGNVFGDSGGALDNSGNLTLMNVAITGNRAVSDTTVIPARGGDAGAIRNDGTITISNSLVANNAADDDAGAVLNVNGTLNATNVTFTGNSANGIEGDGGAIQNTTRTDPVTGLPVGPAPQVVLRNVTLAYNNAGKNGENIRHDSGNITFNNTMLVIDAASAGKNCSIAAGVDVTTNGSNIESLNVTDLDYSCNLSPRLGDRTNLDPTLLLDPLADNGGPTQTMALRTGSLAIDGGNDASCARTDQRGFVRPTDGNGDGVAHCDIGAYEANSAPLAARVYLPFVVNTK